MIGVVSATVKAAVVLAAAGALGIGGWHLATHWRPSPARYPLQGVDLGEDAPALDWGSVRAAHADFAYLTATAGTQGRAAAFEANWQALPEAGLRRGAVHRFSPCEDGRAQADAFNAVVPRTADALPPALAIDVDDRCELPTDLTPQVTRFVAAVEAHMRQPVILRVSPAAERRWHLSAALDRPVWVTGDGIAPGYAAHPWRLWRASDGRRIDGVAQPLNWDVVAP